MIFSSLVYDDDHADSTAVAQCAATSQFRPRRFGPNSSLSLCIHRPRSQAACAARLSPHIPPRQRPSSCHVRASLLLVLGVFHRNVQPVTSACVCSTSPWASIQYSSYRRGSAVCCPPAPCVESYIIPSSSQAPHRTAPARYKAEPQGTWISPLLFCARNFNVPSRRDTSIVHSR